MKLIFSRKGIDDAYGKGASPIFPDGQMFSIPIPVRGKEQGIAYKSIACTKTSSTALMIKHLGIPIKRTSCHLDPDLHRDLFPRSGKWKPCFGHHGAAAKHLLNQGVGVGDMFIFFGSFRKVKSGKYNRWSFQSDTPKQHVIFGFLRIGEILNLKIKEERQEAISRGYSQHPHVMNDYKNINILFIADDSSENAGVFSYRKELVLSQNGSSKSIWELPSFFYDLNISRHENRERFSRVGNKTILKTVGIGQDFVVQSHPELTDWVQSIIRT